MALIQLYISFVTEEKKYQSCLDLKIASVTAYSVLPQPRESTDRLDRASKIFRARLNKLNSNLETDNDIELYLVSFKTKISDTNSASFEFFSFTSIKHAVNENMQKK